MPKTQKDRDRDRKQRRQRKLRKLKRRFRVSEKAADRRELLGKIHKLQPWFDPEG